MRERDEGKERRPSLSCLKWRGSLLPRAERRCRYGGRAERVLNHVRRLARLHDQRRRRRHRRHRRLPRRRPLGAQRRCPCGSSQFLEPDIYDFESLIKKNVLAFPTKYSVVQENLLIMMVMRIGQCKFPTSDRLSPLRFRREAAHRGAFPSAALLHFPISSANSTSLAFPPSSRSSLSQLSRWRRRRWRRSPSLRRRHRR